MESSWFRIQLFLFLCNVLLSHQAYQDTKKTMLFKWKVPEVEYPDEESRIEDTEKGRYVPANVLILDADYHVPTGRYFVTSPLFRTGIPASVWQVVGEQGLLRPFPRWPKYNETSDALSCNTPHSVFRIIIDKCGLMWVLDAGQSIANLRFRLTCQPKLIIYDLNNNDREILRHKFPKSDYSERSTLTTFVIESYKRDCSDSIAYITDERDHGLIIFDYAKKESWRVEDPAFYPWPNQHLFDVNGVRWSVMAGLFGITLGPEELQRKIYFHGFTSVKESWMPVDVLKNKSSAALPYVTGPTIVTSPGERAAQSTTEVMTDDGILIYHLLPQNSLVCWNSKTPFTIENQHLLERDDVNFQYISGMKIKDNNLLITSCRYQRYLYGLENTTETNYRVMVIEDVKSLVANTPCANAPTNYFPNIDSNVVSRFAAAPTPAAPAALVPAASVPAASVPAPSALDTAAQTTASPTFAAPFANYPYDGYVRDTNSENDNNQYRFNSYGDYSQNSLYGGYSQNDPNYGFLFNGQSYNSYNVHPNGAWSVQTR